MVARAWAPLEIPIAAHAAVRAVRVVAGLWAVALGAERARVRERDLATVREAQRLALGRMVTGGAAQRAVHEAEARVGTRDAAGVGGEGTTRVALVAGRARRDRGIAVDVRRTDREPPEDLGDLDGDALGPSRSVGRLLGTGRWALASTSAEQQREGEDGESGRHDAPAMSRNCAKS